MKVIMACLILFTMGLSLPKTFAQTDAVSASMVWTAENQLVHFTSSNFCVYDFSANVTWDFAVATTDLTAVNIAHDGQVYLGYQDGTLVYQAIEEQVEYTLKAHDQAITTIVSHANYVVSSDEAGVIKVWTSEKMDLVNEFVPTQASFSNKLAILPEQDAIAIYSGFALYRWDLNTNIMHYVATTSSYGEVAITFDDVAVDQHSTYLTMIPQYPYAGVYVWDMLNDQGDFSVSLNGVDASAGYTDSAISPDGEYLALATASGVVLLEISRQATHIQLNASHILPSKRTSVITYSPDGQYIATATASGHIQIWDVSTGAEIAQLDACTLPDNLALTLTPTPTE